jgi:hypothetical protein
MNERVKKLWVDALRSGKYRQCRARLKVHGNRDDGPSYCYLGVLEEIAKDEGIISGYDAAGLVLDKTVIGWAELEAADPRVGDGQTLTALSDGGSGFWFIAEQIEQHL